MAHAPKPIVLMILDGWGYRENTAYNPLKTVNTPTFDFLFANYPHILLEASGEAVGLPPGQIGNSEVGHLHIGSGRKVPQNLTRIDNSIQKSDFQKNPILTQAIEKAKAKNAAVHIMGLLSPGGVHSHERQILAMIDLVAKYNHPKNYLHAFLDGRDVPPKSAMASLEKFAKHYHDLPGGQIASIVGRYYAMDRDKRWDRTEQAYQLLVEGKAKYHADSAQKALEMAYERGETDEFVAPTSIHQNQDQPITIEDNDVIIFMNFRADRARQLSKAFIEPNFNEFTRHKTPKLSAFVTLTQYAKELLAEVAYPPLTLQNTLGEYLSAQGFKQLRLAETEKYAHVTYFFNGRIEQPFQNEDRMLIPSPKVATYDLKPEMSAIEVTEQLCRAINEQKYDVIVCNYANPDMVGHTGKLSAAEKSVSVIDNCMQKVIAALEKVHGEALITADHGNIELMYDEKTNQVHTAHTNNPVPLIYFGRKAHFIQNKGGLDDIAPTLLHLLGINQPKEMTGNNLLALDNG